VLGRRRRRLLKTCNTRVLGLGGERKEEEKEELGRQLVRQFVRL
jgi:hypothetical protein